MMSRQQLEDQIRRDLSDIEIEIWTSAEIQGYIQQGYDALCIATGCLWDMNCLPDYANAFGYTSAFELQYMTPGFSLAGLARITAEFERDYIDNSLDPANHTQYWEYEFMQRANVSE